MPTIDGRTLFIPMLHANVLRGNSFRVNLTFETTLFAMLAKVELETGTEVPSERKHFDERGRSLQRCHPKRATESMCSTPVLGTSASLIAMTSNNWQKAQCRRRSIWPGRQSRWKPTLCPWLAGPYHQSLPD